MAFLQNDAVSPREIKEDMCFKDEPIEYFSEDASSSTSYQHSDLQELKIEHDMISVSSSFFMMALDLFICINSIFLFCDYLFKGMILLLGFYTI